MSGPSLGSSGQQPWLRSKQSVGWPLGVSKWQNLWLFWYLDASLLALCGGVTLLMENSQAMMIDFISDLESVSVSDAWSRIIAILYFWIMVMLYVRRNWEIKNGLPRSFPLMVWGGQAIFSKTSIKSDKMGKTYICERWKSTQKAASTWRCISNIRGARWKSWGSVGLPPGASSPAPPLAELARGAELPVHSLARNDSLSVEWRWG